MTRLESICQKLRQRYAAIDSELTRLEVRLNSPAFQARELASAIDREFHEEVKVLRLRHDEGMRRIHEMHAASNEELDQFETEIGGLADTLEEQLHRLTDVWNADYSDLGPDQDRILLESAARLEAAVTT